MFGQWCPLWGAILGADFCGVGVLGFELGELPCVAATATPPPKAESEANAISTAALRPSMWISFRSGRCNLRRRT
jgi:hypothetical protein